MFLPIPTKQQAFALYLNCENTTAQEKRLRIVCFDLDKKNTNYIDRYVILKPSQKREIKLPFPTSPKQMGCSVYNTITKIPAHIPDPSFKATVSRITKLEACEIWIDEQTTAFVKFAQKFSENAGINAPADYFDDAMQFWIRYSDTLTYRSDKYGIIESATPSRIGHVTGKIEVSQKLFTKYSIPGRMVILLHEYSHKYQNPKTGQSIENEMAADLNALYIYLGLGYPRTDAKEMFLNVFQKSPVDQNIDRYKIIEKFITDFDNGKIASCSTRS